MRIVPVNVDGELRCLENPSCQQTARKITSDILNTFTTFLASASGLEGGPDASLLNIDIFPSVDALSIRSTNRAEDIQDFAKGLEILADELRARSPDGRAIFSEGTDLAKSWELLSMELQTSPRKIGKPSKSDQSDLTCDPGGGDDLMDGRKMINSDPLKRAVGSPAIQIGLFDSGVDPTGLGKMPLSSIDCLNGGNDPCVQAQPSDGNSTSHGTKSAAILSSRSPNPTYEGITELPVVSFKIGLEGHEISAVKEAFDLVKPQSKNLRGLPPVSPTHRLPPIPELPLGVILAQVQATGTEELASGIADCAFERGLVVVAPVGNTGTVKHVSSPGNARKVLGVGSVSISNSETRSRAHGPTPDGRIKPDILGPTGTEVPARGPNSCDTHVQTSGAAPYVAGAAALLKNMVVNAFSDDAADDPGLIYPLTLVSGQTPYDPCKTEQVGAGLLRLPTSGKWVFGKSEIAEGEALLVPFGGVPQDALVDAAIWWPEHQIQRHSDLDLQIRNSCGGPQGTRGTSYGSVFERVRTDAQGEDYCPGEPWSLEISAYSVPDPCLKKENKGRQTFYWAVLIQWPAPSAPIDDRHG